MLSLYIIHISVGIGYLGSDALDGVAVVTAAQDTQVHELVHAQLQTSQHLIRAHTENRTKGNTDVSHSSIGSVYRSYANGPIFEKRPTIS